MIFSTVAGAACFGILAAAKIDKRVAGIVSAVSVVTTYFIQK